MPVTINGTAGVTFPDTTVQTTASIPITNFNVIGSNVVGTATVGEGTFKNVGNTYAGSGIRIASQFVFDGCAGGYQPYTQTYPLSGTWRILSSVSYGIGILFVRVS